MENVENIVELSGLKLFVCSGYNDKRDRRQINHLLFYLSYVDSLAFFPCNITCIGF